MLDGYFARLEREQYRVAWLASHLMSAWVKKGPTPEKLLGKAFMDRMRARRTGPQTRGDEDE